MKTHLTHKRRPSVISLTTFALLSVTLLFGQPTPPQPTTLTYTGNVITGELVRQGTVNLTQAANAPAEPTSKAGKEIHPNRRPLLRPPLHQSGVELERAPAPLAPQASPTATPNVRGFTGLTHLEERNARGGNQFSTEPPDQALAVGKGVILE